MLFPPGRILRRGTGANPSVPDQSPEVGGGYHCCRVQGEVGDRVVFQGPQAEPAGENLCGNLGERAADADLDGADRDVADQIPATAVDLRLVVVEPGGTAAATTIRVPRSLVLDLPSVSSTAAAGSRVGAIAVRSGAIVGQQSHKPTSILAT